MLVILLWSLSAICLCCAESRLESRISSTACDLASDDSLEYPNWGFQLGWLRQDPFSFWEDRHLYSKINDLDIKEEDINRAIKWKESEPACRSQALMSKVLKGQPVKMTVIGGSNSAGGGITNHKQLFHQLFSQWWNQVVLPNTRSKLTVENLSLGGTGSEFFTLCLQNFLTGNNLPDIVLIELSVNDYGYLYGKTATPMELLTRRVLSLPSCPLALYVSLVDVVSQKRGSFKSIKNPYCHNLEDLGQRKLSEHYEVPLLSWRDVLCPLNPKTGKKHAFIRPGMVNNDYLHIDKKGHGQVALMLIRYFQNTLQRVAMKAGLGLKAQCSNMGLNPPLYADGSLLVTSPLCWAFANPGWGTSAVHQSLLVRVTRMLNFKELKLESFKARMGYNGNDDRADAFGGWRSTRKESFIEFSFQVPKRFDGLPNRYSVGIVIRRMTQNSGQVKMWLDSNKHAGVVIAGKKFGRVHFQTRVYFVAPKVWPGHHTVSLETKGNKAIGLLISGVVLGPAGIHGFQGYKPIDTLEKVWSLEDYEKFKIHS